MASKSSKSLPFIVLAMAMLLAVVEIQTGRQVPIEEMMPLFLTVGVAGVPLAAAKKFAEAMPKARAAARQVVGEPEKTG